MKPPSSRRPTPPPSITEAEWLVMQVVWRQQPVTANQVVLALEPKTDWKPKTIHTLLRRLVQKKALRYEKIGREFQYRPCVEAAQCTHFASRSFLDRFFGGHLAPFLACFLEREKLAPEELEELRRILNEKIP